MTEFVATALLVSLLALCVRPASDKLRVVLTAAVLAVLVAAIRVQYAPLALVVLGLFFLRTEKKTQLVLIAASVFVAVGVFDAITWDGGLFHSYVVNIRVNLALGDLRVGESPAWQFLYWLLIANMGLVALCVLALPDLPTLRIPAGAYRPDAADPLDTVAQGISLYLRRHSALAADWRRLCGVVRVPR